MSKLQKAWELRYSGKIESARALVAEIGEPTGAFERSELCLLECSFARSAHRMEEAFAWIEKAKQALAASKQPATFQLCMQTAICFDVQSRFAESLRLYQEAVRLSSNDFEKALAKVNLAICTYNLSLPFAHLISELDALFARLPEHPLAASANQLRLMELKNLVQEGRLLEAIRLPFSGMSQGLYLQAWIEALPWSPKAGKLPRFLELASSEELFFLKEFRLQTLQIDPRLAAVEHTGSIQVKADRLFLWCWKWLANPASIYSILLAQELRRFPFADAHLTLTSEDFMLLRSCGSWLSLYSPAFAAPFQAWMSKTLPPLPASPFFDLDLACQKAVKAGDSETLARLERSSPAALAGYFHFLRGLLPREEVLPEGSLTVRLSDGSLRGPHGNLVSEPMAALLAQLLQEPSLSFEQAAREAFGIRTYVPEVHGAKIHNLLQRLKKLAPADVVVRTKNQRIFLEAGAELIALQEGSPHQKHFPLFAFPELGKKQTLQSERLQKTDLKARFLSEFQGRARVSRSELEKQLSLPKATANRLLLRWTKEGFLRASGKGSARSYSLAPRK